LHLSLLCVQAEAWREAQRMRTLSVDVLALVHRYLQVSHRTRQKCWSWSWQRSPWRYWLRGEESGVKQVLLELGRIEHGQDLLFVVRAQVFYEAHGTQSFDD